MGVSVLCPSFFPTNIIKSAKGGAPGETAFAEKLMARSPHSAEDIARIALDACKKGDLHILPHVEGRWFWRMRRLLPQRSLELAINFQRRASKSRSA